MSKGLGPAPGAGGALLRVCPGPDLAEAGHCSGEVARPDRGGVRQLAREARRKGKPEVEALTTKVTGEPGGAE